MHFPLAVFSQYIFGPLLFLLSFFIIAIILLQRGRGGGLTGALGGLGGQSAFGVKAGDIFTRITAIAVILWIFVAAFACFWYKPPKLDIEADPASMSPVNDPLPRDPDLEGIKKNSVPSGKTADDIKGELEKFPIELSPSKSDEGKLPANLPPSELPQSLPDTPVKLPLELPPAETPKQDSTEAPKSEPGSAEPQDAPKPE